MSRSGEVQKLIGDVGFGRGDTVSGEKRLADSFPGAETTGLGSEVAGEGESKSPARWG
jgi:hypothetical protein